MPALAASTIHNYRRLIFAHKQQVFHKLATREPFAGRKFEKEKKMRMISLFHTLVFMVTVLTFSVPFVTLAQQNALQAEAIADAEKDAAIDVDTTRWFWTGCFGGVAALIQVYEPSPPVSRLIGKSPEYIAYYTDAYKAKASELQSSAVKKGCLTAGAVYGCGIIGSIVLLADAWSGPIL